MARAKKHLGQHFLTAPNTIQSLAGALSASRSTPVVEIGPGTGALTEALLERFDSVIAIEKDPDLVRVLTQQFNDTGLNVIEGDALDFSPTELGLRDDYVVVGNVPYYITGALFRTMLSIENQPQEIAFLIQREVAERIVERDGKSSVLSLSVGIYGTPSIVTHVKPGAFAPPPKVDSSIVHVSDISRERLHAHNISDEIFFDYIKRGFAHKRKTLRNNLNLSREVLSAHNLSPNIRAEDVPLATWLELIASLESN